MKYSSDKLIKLLMLLSIFSFVILAFVLTMVFTNALNDGLSNSLSHIAKKDDKNAKIEAQDRIEKLTTFIDFYKKTLEEKAKERLVDNVNFATDIIDEIYNRYQDFPQGIIYQRIKDRLRDIRFFDDKTGYFFIYDLKGNCILLPTHPKLEGTNQINLQDSKKQYTIQRMIEIVKTKNSGFLSWFWYKPGEKTMKEKLGFVQLYKPLGIFIGTARYEESILSEIKKDVNLYLHSLKKNDYGYIFAYDFSGNSMLESENFKKINRWNDIIQGEHIVRDAIKGAQIIPGGFFMKYKNRDGKENCSYLKLIPEFKWVIGTKVQNKKAIFEKEKAILKQNTKRILKNSILILILIVSLFIIGFWLITFKIKQLFRRIKKAEIDKARELDEQKNIFKILFDKASDGIALSKHKKLYACNNEIVKMMGADSKEEFLKLDTEDLFPATQEDGKNSIEFLESKLDIAREKGKVDFEIEGKKLNGELIWLHISSIVLDIREGRVGYFVFRDITRQKKMEKDLLIEQDKLLFQATHDSLTSLPNRTLMMDRLHECLKKAKREKRYLEVLFLDIDNFKVINDALGHETGDLLLIEISSVFRELVREVDVVSRFGGDEFVMILNGFKNKGDSSIIINKIIKRFQEPFYIQNNPFNLTLSIGISVYPDDSSDEHDLLKYADMAMYRAKNSGKNRYVYYERSMNVDVLKHIKIEKEIRDGIKNDEFILYYQPQYSTIGKEIVGFEALVRWQHPTLGLKFPDYFIQIAENSSLIVDLGELISKKAISQVALWYKQGLNPGIVSINFTSRQLESRGFFDNLQKIIEEAQCKPEWIEAELVERYIMSNTERTAKFLDKFKSMGINVAIDDFGTGYSSLGYLKYLDISKLKIDKKFIDDLATDKKDRAITKSIVDLSKGLDLKVIAEGVETKEQYRILKRLGCQIIQGYYFSKPIPSADAELLLRKQLRAPLEDKS